MTDNVVELITNKSDAELSEEYTKKLEEAYKPVIQVLQEADANNLICNVGVGKNAFGKFQILQLQILNKFIRINSEPLRSHWLVRCQGPKNGNEWVPGNAPV